MLRGPKSVRAKWTASGRENLLRGLGLPRDIHDMDYMPTHTAAEYLGRSQSWLLKRNDIPYVRGTPNLYRRKDLDSWFERNKFKPIVE